MKRIIIILFSILLSNGIYAQSASSEHDESILSYDEFMNLLFLGSYDSTDENPNRLVNNLLLIRGGCI